MSNLLYSKDHEWVLSLEGNRVRIGISDYAQNSLGDIVFVENPEEGDDVTVIKSSQLAMKKSVKLHLERNHQH